MPSPIDSNTVHRESVFMFCFLTYLLLSTIIQMHVGKLLSPFLDHTPFFTNEGGGGSLALIAYLAVQMGPKERYTHHCKEHNKGPKTHDHISRRIVILDENQTVEKKTN